MAAVRFAIVGRRSLACLSAAPTCGLRGKRATQPVSNVLRTPAENVRRSYSTRNYPSIAKEEEEEEEENNEIRDDVEMEKNLIKSESSDANEK